MLPNSSSAERCPDKTTFEARQGCLGQIYLGFPDGHEDWQAAKALSLILMKILFKIGLILFHWSTISYIWTIPNKHIARGFNHRRKTQSPWAAVGSCSPISERSSWQVQASATLFDKFDTIWNWLGENLCISLCISALKNWRIFEDFAGLRLQRQGEAPTNVLPQECPPQRCATDTAQWSCGAVWTKSKSVKPV